MSTSEDSTGQPIEKPEKKTSRRKAIKTAIAGTAVVGTAGQIGSGKWTKPVVDSVIIPAHAATTGSGGDPGEGTTTPVPCPDGPLTCAKGSVDFQGTSSKVGSSVLGGESIPGFSTRGRILNVTATVCPPVAGVNIVLTPNITSESNVSSSNAHVSSIGGGTPQLTNASGVATFAETNFNFVVEGGESSGSIDLNLVFTTGSDDCTLNYTFTETVPVP